MFNCHPFLIPFVSFIFLAEDIIGELQCDDFQIDSVGVSPLGRVFISQGDKFWILERYMYPTNDNAKLFSEYCEPGFKSDIAVWVGMDYTKTECDFSEDGRIDSDVQLFLIQRAGPTLKSCFLFIPLDSVNINSIDLNATDSILERFYRGVLIEEVQRSYPIKELNSVAYRSNVDNIKNFVLTDTGAELTVYECSSIQNEIAKWHLSLGSRFSIHKLFKFDRDDLRISAMWRQFNTYFVVTNDKAVYECFLVDIYEERLGALKQKGKPCKKVSNKLAVYLKIKSAECDGVTKDTNATVTIQSTTNSNMKPQKAKSKKNALWVGMVALGIILAMLALAALVWLLMLRKSKKRTSESDESGTNSSIEESGKKLAPIKKESAKKKSEKITEAKKSSISRS